MAGLAIAIGRVKPRVLEALLVRVECAAKAAGPSASRRTPRMRHIGVACRDQAEREDDRRYPDADR